MSTAELQAIVEKLAASQAETTASQAETAELQAETAASQAETARQMKESRKDADHRMKDADRRMKDADRRMKETDRQMKTTDRKIKELGRQIGGFGNKFGTFAEGLSYNSIRRILEEKFEMNEFIAPAVQFKREGREEEYDILAYSNGKVAKGMVVEIKSRLRQEDIDQMKRKMDEVFFWLPEHTNKTFHGMVAYVSGDADLKKQIIGNGWYLAHVGDEIFEMEIPVGFTPRAYASVNRANPFPPLGTIQSMPDATLSGLAHATGNPG